MEICLPFEITDEVSENIAKIDKHEDHQRNRPDEAENGFRGNLAFRQEDIEGLTGKHQVHERFDQQAGEDTETADEQDIEEKMTFFHMTYLMGHDRLQFGKRHGLDDRRRQQDIPEPRDKAHHRRGEGLALEQRPEVQPGGKALFRAELEEMLLQRPVGELPAAPEATNQGRKKEHQEKKKNDEEQQVAPFGGKEGLQGRDGDHGRQIGEQRQDHPGQNNRQVDLGIGGDKADCSVPAAEDMPVVDPSHPPHQGEVEEKERET